MHDTRTSNATEWKDTPLCREYLLVFAGTLSIQLEGAGDTEDRTLSWSFGILADGQQEILGAWRTTEGCEAGWREVFDDLKERGVENIQFVASEDPETVLAALREVYPKATSIPSLQQALVSRSDLPPRLRRALRDNGDKVAKLQRDALRAIARHERFADSAAAAAFVVDALHRAEQRINLAQARCDTVSGKTVRRTRGLTPSHPGL